MSEQSSQNAESLKEGLRQHLGWYIHLYDASVVFIALLFMIGAGLLMWYLGSVEEIVIRKSALTSVEEYSKTLLQFRNLYVSQIVSRLDPNGRNSSLPLASTLMMEMAKSEKNTPNNIRVLFFTSYPTPESEHESFNAKTKDLVDLTTPHDSFEKKAWAELIKNPEKPYYFIDRHSLRYAIADYQHPSCRGIHCKRDKMRGMIEIIYPITESVTAGEKNLLLTAIAVLSIIFLSLLGLSFGFRSFYDKAKKTVEIEMLSSEHRLRSLADSSILAIIVADEYGDIISWNIGAIKLFGYNESEAVGSSLDIIIPERYRKMQQDGLQRMVEEGEKRIIGKTVELYGLKKDGDEVPVEITLSTWVTEEGRFFSAIILDISERKRLETKLIHSQKIESVGFLAAGVAHEINNPVGFIKSNISTLKEYLRVFKELLVTYSKLGKLAKSQNPPLGNDLLAEVDDISQREDLAYILQDIDGLMFETQEGIMRVQDIVQSLKTFTHTDEAAQTECDVHDSIEAAIKVVWNELKYRCEIHKDFARLPRIPCFPGLLNQVFANLLINSGHAIGEDGDIWIRTRQEGDEVVIELEDNGKGMNEEQMTRIFEPFYTTKAAGEGSGLGLAISMDIIEKHYGTIDVKSTVGQGTVFSIRLPIKLKVRSYE